MSDTCETCKDWGRTLTEDDQDAPVIPCPDCRRLTWANLGVNCPAGCAVALSSQRAMWHLRPQDTKLFSYNEFRNFLLEMR